MTPEDYLIPLIKQFEGLKFRSYLCPAGVWTIGYGSTGPDIGPGLVWTKAQAENRLIFDMHNCTASVKKLCPGLSAEKIAAMADFAYNLGATRLAGSTLRRKANKGDYVGASQEFPKWIYARGAKLNGLILRREVERRLFLS